MSGDATPGLAGAIPPGWYADPAGSPAKRWWDGAQWTTHMQEPEEAPALATFGNYVPAELRPVHPIPVADIGTAYSRAGWWLAFSPVWVVVPQVAVVESVVALSPSTSPSTFTLPLIILNLLVWFGLVGLGYADRTKLLSAGNNSSPSPWWIVLTPLVYFILRAPHVREYATGAWAYVIWWCIAVFVTPGLSLAVFFAAYGTFAVS